jgi:hypothetical protein
MRAWIKACAALLCVLLLGACKGGDKVRYFSYLDEPIELALSGKLDGTPFTATLRSEGRTTAAGDLTQSNTDFTLTYLSPPALAGVRVEYDADTNQTRISFGELHAQGEVYAALGTPAALLLGESPVTSARREKNGSIYFETMDGAHRTLDKSGRPTQLTWSGEGRTIEVRVEEWTDEKGKNR